MPIHPATIESGSHESMGMRLKRIMLEKIADKPPQLQNYNFKNPILDVSGKLNADGKELLNEELRIAYFHRPLEGEVGDPSLADAGVKPGAAYYVIQGPDCFLKRDYLKTILGLQVGSNDLHTEIPKLVSVGNHRVMDEINLSHNITDIRIKTGKSGVPIVALYIPCAMLEGALISKRATAVITIATGGRTP